MKKNYPSKFHKGQIVRRKTLSGSPIGPYLKITGISYNTITAVPIDGSNKLGVLIQKEHVATYTMKSLIVSEDILRRLYRGETTVVTHPVTPLWQKLYMCVPELVRFHTSKTSDEHIFFVDNVDIIFSAGQTVVKLTVADVII